MGPARVMIATPTPDGKVTSVYMRSVMQIVQTFQRERPEITFDIEMTSGSDLHVVRNVLAARFLANPDRTHLLFLDSDMFVSPNLVFKYLLQNKPFVGAIYPFRSVAADRVFQMGRIAETPDQVEPLALDYVCADQLLKTPHPSGTAAYSLENGLVRAKRVGTGAMMVTREVFTRIEQCYPELLLKEGSASYRRCGVSGPVLQCFAPLQNEDGEFFSEDESFCERWTRSGGEIWASVDENVTHVGAQHFTGRYLDRMKRGLFQV